MKLIKPNLYIKVLGRTYGSFLFLAVAGYVMGVSCSFFIAWKMGLDLAVIFLLSGTSAFTCLGLIWIIKVITGKEIIVYYQHEIAILLVTALVLFLINQPVLIYLEIILMGIGTMAAIGRWGCYMVGCCHGKPCECKVSVRYGKEHVQAGFPSYYEGLKLFPIPLVESVLLVLIILVSIWIKLSGYPPGTSLISYTVLYGFIRFVLEFYRGDPERPIIWYLSEAQWTTLLLLVAASVLGYYDLIPFHQWHLWLTLLTVISGLLIVAIYQFGGLGMHQLYLAKHIKEIAQIATALNSNKHQASGSLIPLMSTSFGLVISMAVLEEGPQLARHYTLSSQNLTLKVNEISARRIGNILSVLFHNNDHYVLRAGSQGSTYHILFQEAPKP